MKEAALAEEIRRGILGEAKKPSSADGSCELCGRGCRATEPFCSDRCGQYYTDGFPVPDPNYARKALDAPLKSWAVVAGHFNADIDDINLIFSQLPRYDAVLGDDGRPKTCSVKVGPGIFSTPDQVVVNAVYARQRSRRQPLGADADHVRLKKFIVAADMDFKALRKPSPLADWRIAGEFGSIFVVGPDGFHLSVETHQDASFLERAPEWDEGKRRLDFCRYTGEGRLYLNRLPTGKEGTAICRVLGIQKSAWQPSKASKAESQENQAFLTSEIVGA